MIAWREPLGLWALAALAMPLLVHLWRRTPLRVVNFPAQRYLDPATTPSRQRWQLHDLVLLLLRLLLVTALALLLAMPVWRGPAEPAPPVTLRVPGIATSAVPPPTGAPQPRWLAPGLPVAAPELTGRADAQRTSLWSLLREADANLPAGTPVIVEAPAEVGPLDAVRPEFGRPLEWHVVPGTSGTVAATRPPPPRLAIRYDARGRGELPVARAIAAAWRARGSVSDVTEAGIATPLAADVARVIWLADASAPDLRRFIAAGGAALVTRLPDGPTAARLADEHGSAFLLEQRRGHGLLLILTAALEPAALPPLAAPDFPDRLEQAFARPQAAARAVGLAAAPVAPPVGAAATVSRPLDGVIVALIVLLYASERLLALRAPANAA